MSVGRPIFKTDSSFNPFLDELKASEDNDENNINNIMYVIKRNGEREEVSFDKIMRRIKFLSTGLNVNVTGVAQKVIAQIKPNITTSELDLYSADICIQESSINPDYGVMASRILISNHHKMTSPSFSEAVEILYRHKDNTGKWAPLINDEVYELVMANKNKINDVIDHNRDYRHDFFGFKTLERAYLLRSNGRIIERPQYMWMRVALGIHRNDFKDAIETYDLMSKGYFTHATPTLFNAGTCREQLSSCFLLTMKDDSIKGIYDTLEQCALISQFAGGIGLSVHTVRSRGSYIRGTSGTSNGLIPMLKVYNATARYVDQCFHPDTYVYTTAGPKKICHLEAGMDSVYNINGEPQTIDKVLNHCFNGHYRTLVLENDKYNNRIHVTPMHPIYVSRDNKSPEWIEVKELNVGDTIFMPKIKRNVIDVPEITETMCVLYGLMFQYFDIKKCGVYDGKFYVHVSKSQHPEDHQLLLNILDDNVIQYVVYDDHTIVWKSSPNFCFTFSDFWKSTSDDRDKFSWNDIQISQRILLLPSNKLSIIYDRIHGSKYGSNSQQQIRFIYQCINPSSQYQIKQIYDGHTDDMDKDGNMLMYDLEFKEEHNYVTECGLVHNGGGKRPGSFAIYLEPHHPDIMHFLDMKKNTGNEDYKARDLFYALWISDLFMERVENNEHWTLLDPDEFKGLADVYGDKYREMYLRYEKEFQLKYRHQPKVIKRKILKARDIWSKIIETQVETGALYMGYKDAVNLKSNQSNLGTIRSSNLCIEINLFTSPDEVAVCNLASICLPMFVNKEKKTFDFEKLQYVVKVATKNLNKVIDVNYYPVAEAKNSNLKHRPIGIGVQGLADTFALLRMPFDSPEARELNKQIAEHMYYAGVEASMEISRKRDGMIKDLILLADETHKDWHNDISVPDKESSHNLAAIQLILNIDAIKTKFEQEINEWQTALELSATIGNESSGLHKFEGRSELLGKMRRLFKLVNILKLIPQELTRTEYYGSYSSFIGSPMHAGKYQYDLWNHTPSPEMQPKFDALRQEIQKYGIRNSTLFAYMPTASTSQIQGNNECFEPYTYNIYTRRVLSGEHKVINKHLINDLIELGIWSKTLKDKIIADGGSVQNIDEIPENIKELYKTVWEISQQVIIDYAADRSPFICQTQSMNLFLSDPSYESMSSMHFYAWKKGLKTGMYYLRTRTQSDAQKVTVDPKIVEEMERKKRELKELKDNADNLPIREIASDGETDEEMFVCNRDNPDCEMCGS